jgi:hypothetical protein
MRLQALQGTYYVQIDRKVTRPIPDTCSVCQEINYIEIKNKKQCYIKFWKCPLRSATPAFTFFPHVSCNPVKSSCSDRKWFTRRDTVDLFGTGELNSFWQVK